MILKNKKVSIIIRTRNEEQWIEICLRKIFEQTYKNIEVIIVDNCSTDKTIEKIKNFNIQIVKIKNFFPGKAINIGIKKSTGEYIVCLSAHCIPTNRFWLKNLINDLKKNKVAAVYGKQSPLPYSSPLDKRDLYNTFGSEKRVQKKDTFFHNANSAFHKKIWKKQPFDEKILHIEDRVWADKIISSGYKIIYEPRAEVFHWHGINQSMDLKRCQEIVSILEKLNYLGIKKESLIKFKNLRCAAIIPIRGKTGYFNKDTSLLKITIDQVKKSRLLKEIYVDTDNLANKKIAIANGAKVPFIRETEFSNFYVDLISAVKNYIEKLESSGKFFDLVVVLTEKFPFRPNNIFDKIIKKAINNNYDSVITYQALRGSVFLKEKNKLVNFIDGTIPSSINKEAFFSRLGVACVFKTSHLRKGRVLDGKLGFCKVNSYLSFLEFDNKIHKKLSF